MREAQDRGIQFVEIVAETRRDSDVEIHFCRLFPRQAAESPRAQIFLDTGGEHGIGGLDAEELDPLVMEGREHVGDAGGRGDAVDDDQHPKRGPSRSPSRLDGEHAVARRPGACHLVRHKPDSILRTAITQQRVPRSAERQAAQEQEAAVHCSRGREQRYAA
ncbi:hypothetical protein [Marinitenerispora sediminis]|uniref:hypothetical protein n=1 Tax=Marinitenerispora sediminis TaxID=1931232 RepID=UPI0011C0508C|nr:hypothetical protein [Marinitenerispora sediminis]